MLVPLSYITFCFNVVYVDNRQLLIARVYLHYRIVSYLYDAVGTNQIKSPLPTVDMWPCQASQH